MKLNKALNLQTELKTKSGIVLTEDMLISDWVRNPKRTETGSM